jgi:hypothetical protein
MKRSKQRAGRKNRITLTMHKRGFIHIVCSDEDIRVYLVNPDSRVDRVYRWSSTKVGREYVENELGDWQISDKDNLPVWH